VRITDRGLREFERQFGVAQAASLRVSG
jgi:hypothetical protein